MNFEKNDSKIENSDFVINFHKEDNKEDNKESINKEDNKESINKEDNKQIINKEIINKEDNKQIINKEDNNDNKNDKKKRKKFCDIVDNVILNNKIYLNENDKNLYTLNYDLIKKKDKSEDKKEIELKDVDNIAYNYDLEYNYYKDYNDNIDINDNTDNHSDKSESILLWNNTIVEQYIEFGNLCKDISKICKKNSKYNKNMGVTVQLFLFLFGFFIILISLSLDDENIKTKISTALGGIISLLTLIREYFKFEKKSVLEFKSSIELDKLYKITKRELAKPIQIRNDPYSFIVKLDNEREEILKKISIDDVD